LARALQLFLAGGLLAARLSLALPRQAVAAVAVKSLIADHVRVGTLFAPTDDRRLHAAVVHFHTREAAGSFPAQHGGHLGAGQLGVLQSLTHRIQTGARVSLSVGIARHQALTMLFLGLAARFDARRRARIDDLVVARALRPLRAEPIPCAEGIGLVLAAPAAHERTQAQHTGQDHHDSSHLHGSHLIAKTGTRHPALRTGTASRHSIFPLFPSFGGGNGPRARLLGILDGSALGCRKSPETLRYLEQPGLLRKPA